MRKGWSQVGARRALLLQSCRSHRMQAGDLPRYHNPPQLRRGETRPSGPSSHHACARSQAPRAAWGKMWGFPVWIVKGERAEPWHTSQDPTARYIHVGLWAVHAHTVL